MNVADKEAVSQSFDSDCVPVVLLDMMPCIDKLNFIYFDVDHEIKE